MVYFPDKWHLSVAGQRQLNGIRKRYGKRKKFHRFTSTEMFGNLLIFIVMHCRDAVSIALFRRRPNFGRPAGFSTGEILTVRLVRGRPSRLKKPLRKWDGTRFFFRFFFIVRQNRRTSAINGARRDRYDCKFRAICLFLVGFSPTNAGELAGQLHAPEKAIRNQWIGHGNDRAAAIASRKIENQNAV